MEQSALERCREALRELEACVERELKQYGEQGYDEVKEMESEAPAPSPCEDHYNAVVAALLDYDGPASDIDLGKHHTAIHRRLELERS